MAPDDEKSWLAHQKVVLKGLEISEANDEKLDIRLRDAEGKIKVMEWQFRALWLLFGGTIAKVIHDWMSTPGGV